MINQPLKRNSTQSQEATRMLDELYEVEFYNGGPLDGGIKVTEDKPEDNTIFYVAQDAEIDYKIVGGDVYISSEVKQIVETDKDVHKDFQDKTLHSYLFHADRGAIYHGTYPR